MSKGNVDGEEMSFYESKHTFEGYFPYSKVCDVCPYAKLASSNESELLKSLNLGRAQQPIQEIELIYCDCFDIFNKSVISAREKITKVYENEDMKTTFEFKRLSNGKCQQCGFKISVKAHESKENEVNTLFDRIKENCCPNANLIKDSPILNEG